MSAWAWVAVVIVGGCAAILRFTLDTAIGQRAGRDFPFGTLAINLSGSLVLGLLTGLAVEGNLLIIVGTATIGSYTTFSTWMLESHRLAEDAEIPRAAINIALSLTVGFGAALLGRTIGVNI